MTRNDFWSLPVLHYVVYLGKWFFELCGVVKLWRHPLLSIAVVGDLSLQDPDRLDNVLKHAMKNADLVVQVGDMHPGYKVIKKHLKSGKLLTIPGNHDDKYDTINQPRQWVKNFHNCTLVGLDNADDLYNDETWKLLDSVKDTAARPMFVFTHKPLSPVILPNGIDVGHIVGEHGNPQALADANRLKEWLSKEQDILLICGHYHGWTYQRTAYSDVLVEGRGGAAPELGYTLILLTEDGFVFHKVTLDERHHNHEDNE